jgi:hypothetical protein
MSWHDQLLARAMMRLPDRFDAREKWTAYAQQE